MFSKIVIIFSVILLSSFSYAIEIDQNSLSFDYMSSDGAFWLDCYHEKGEQPHQWIVKCGKEKIQFRIHLLIREYNNADRDEVTVEFHYWADRDATPLKSATQSTWITMNKNSNTKKIIGYLGFDNDANQLRIEVKF